MSAERELARIERRALRSPDVAGWLALAAELRRLLDEQPDEVRSFVERLRAVPVEQTLATAAGAAFAAGLNDGVAILDAAGRPIEPRRRGLPASVSALLQGIDEAGRIALGQAQALTLAVDIDPRTIAAPVLGHARRVTATTADVVTAAAAEGEIVAAEESRVPLVWVAETTACVHCLAYSGVVVEPGDDFPPGLTYGRRTPHGSPGRTPPLHPNCRCEVEPLRAPEYAEALRREADRSVLRGFSLESESMRTRIQAAEDLLKRGVDAPKSVIDFSRRAVSAGKFPTRDRPS